jgi:archaellum component FlaC
MTVDERIEALVMSVELISRDVETLRGTVGILRDTVEVDATNIRALARIAEIHERRLTGLEGGND